MERELKFRLDGEAAWRALLGALGNPREALEQVNLYLETPARGVLGARAMLRLRCEGGAWTFTYKRGVRVEGGYFQAREVEVPLPAGPWDPPDGRALEALEELPPLQALRAEGIEGPLALRGRVRNLRQRFPLPNGDVLELDRTFLPSGRQAFEVEVETLRPEEARALLGELAGRAGVVLHVQERTKYERFLEDLEGS